MTDPNQNQSTRLLISLELVWWLLTAAITAAVLFPIYSNLPNYPFYLINIIYIVAFITLTRYIFLLKFTFLANRQILKIVVVFLCIPFVFYLVQGLNLFQTYIDEEGIDALVGSLPFEEKPNMINYLRSQMLLFGTGSIIGGVILPFRLIVSVWRTRNRGTV